MSKTILAIDFGTSNSLVGAVCGGKRIEALPIDVGAPDPTLMRTLLFFPDGDRCFYGSEAIKRFIEVDCQGRLFRSFKSHLPNQRYLGTMIGNRALPLEDMIGIFLLEIKKRAEALLGTKVTRAVLGRPARYSMDDVADGFAVHRMRKAAEFAGFEEIEFVPEPLAAALDYRRKIQTEKLVLIGDFGGGTSDFTLIRLSSANFKKSDVLAIDGCPLAGDALDGVFMSHRLNRFFGAKAKYRMPMSSNHLTMPNSVIDCLNKPAHIVHLKERATYAFIQDVRKCTQTGEDKAAVERLQIMIDDNQIFPFFEEIEVTKRGLSLNSEWTFNFDYPGLEIQEKFMRADFVSWADPIRNEIFVAMDRTLTQAGVQDNDVDLVFLTGGTSHVPFIRRQFVQRFGATKLNAETSLHSVLSGLIEHAANLS